MSNNKCFSFDCEPIGGSATPAELFASVAMGGTIASRFERERQMTNLSTSAREMATKRRERVNIAGKILSAFTPSLIIYLITTYLFKLVWWLVLIIIIAFLAIMCFIVCKFDFLKKLIIKITFNKRLTMDIIKRNGLSTYDQLTIDDFNTVIAEQYKIIIISTYGEMDTSKYPDMKINENDLTKRKIKFKRTS